MIQTARLELIPATQELVQAALVGPRPLEALLHAVVPDTWPHEYLDSDAFEYFLRLAQGADQFGWCADADRQRRFQRSSERRRHA